jgi:hypothetical protein
MNIDLDKQTMKAIILTYGSPLKNPTNMSLNNHQTTYYLQIVANNKKQMNLVSNNYCLHQISVT